MSEKQELLSKVKNYVEIDNSMLADLFKIISDNWQAMQTQQSERRDSKHRFGLSEMLDNVWSIALSKKTKPKLFTNLECCTILEAADAVIPSGVGGSTAQKELMAHLAKSCRALGWKPGDDFITKVREKKEFLNNLYNSNPEE